VAAVVVACSIGFGIYCFYRRRKEFGESVNLSNPMVLNLAVAVYDKKPKAPEFDGYVADLIGLEFDLCNTDGLFGDKLNYDCFPNYDLAQPKMAWTKAEVVEFLDERAAALEANLRSDSAVKYDGLVVVISGHGINQQIITSDYKLLSKLDIHRCFSKQGHAFSRMIARIFLFDCCDGNFDHGKFGQGTLPKGNSIEANLADLINGAGATAADVVPPNDGHNEGDAETETDHPKVGNDGNDDNDDGDEKKEANEISVSSEALWAHGTEHPDYRLAKLDASTRGFQSKLNTGSGSYLITGFVQRAEKALSAKGYVPRIGPIFKDIQRELGRERKKQQPSYNWYNDTENVQFLKRKKVGGVAIEQQKSVAENYLELTTPQSAQSEANSNGQPTLELVMSQSEGKGVHAQQSSTAL